ncbi:T9SS C-terminal target domain-containing protein [Sphingobacteriales bacterium UPWRP_1]|nr:hypothetical protein BVG80_14065 [Sphingobacteriales bacterium TSM_CSM]PSJ77001.1 T9SS C-terminal target domain-containing protein [Sphingobacteriales bacterium UPWRP_1]
MNLKSTLYFIVNLLIGLTIAAVPLKAQIVPNDVCDDALPFPPLVSGVTACINGDNTGANGELPYINQGYCLGGTTMPAPAADIWYSFTAVSNIIDLDITFDADTIVVAMYEGTCAELIGRECEVSFGGVLNTTFAPVAPGVTYYLQISGGSVSDQGEFGICLTNYGETIDEICIFGQTLNVAPAPVLGVYPPGENINFCFTVDGYNQNASDWFHGLVPVFGDGWDVSTLGYAPPNSCSTNGFWDWYDSVQGTTDVAATIGPQGPGFFYESSAGSPAGVEDGNPGNNYGDPWDGSCDWTFCFSISTNNCPPGENGSDLSITFLNFSDSETGSWDVFSICPEDPNYTFKALLACCTAPAMTGVNPTCASPNGGSITATPTTGSPPYIYEWSNGFVEETIGSSSISGLAQGFYTVTTTDGTGCAVAASFTLVEQTTGFDVVIPVSIQGCSGCEVGPANPGNVAIVAPDGSTFATVQVNSCPYLINICLPETGSFGLSYNGQTIEGAVVNGVLTAPSFTFTTGSPSFAGTMSDQTAIICAGLSTAIANNGDEILSNGAILTYGLCTNPDNVAGTLIATNPAGAFDAAGLQYNTTYYVVAIAGPEGSTPGVPDLNSGCTDISNGTPVVFLSPVAILTDEFCDWLTGDYHIVLFVTGGYPAYDAGASYSVVGDFNGALASGESVEILFPEGSTTSYQFEVINDGFGCTGAIASENFVCYKTPIELLSFTGRALPKGNQLLWSTATEQNNDYFTLERSTNNGQTFEVIATIDSKGNSVTTQSYEFLDTNAPAGLSYYRLSDTDFNGTRTFAPNIVALQRNQTGLEIVAVSPVPASDWVTINYTAVNEEPITVNVYNAAGQLVHTQRANAVNSTNQIQLDVSSYPAGVYMLSLTAPEGQVVTKLVKK